MLQDKSWDSFLKARNHTCYKHDNEHLPLEYALSGTVVLEEIQCIAILGLISRTTVASLSVPKDTRCKTHPLCVNPDVPF